MTDASPRLAYRPALDGLRAVAVLAVMFYHGGLAVLGGGFLGVDVFFVLSGFLITTLLLLAFEANGRLDLAGFWGRRARRLLPALFLVLIAVLIYSAFLAGEAASAVRSDVLATLFYVSNWWFIASGNSYFEQFQDPSPLTHTWSLAIEEQWYLLLPLALILFLPRIRGRRWWLAIFVGLALLSAALMALLYTPGADPSRVYYGTDTRLMALLIGAGLASLFTPGVIERLHGPARWLGPAAVVGLLLLFTLTDDTAQWLYRGGFLLVAVVAVILLAAVVARPDGLVARGLALAPVVWVGKISYGLYLWHWPVYVVLSPARTGLTGPSLLVLRFGVTFAVAALSYYLVEMPVRRGALSRLTQPQRVAVVLVAPLAVLGLLGLTTAAARPPAPDSLEAIRDSATETPSQIARSPDRSPSPSEDVSAVLVGDSIALSLYAAFQPQDVPGLTVVPGTEFGCGLVSYTVSLNGARLQVRDECEQWEQRRASVIAESGANLAVMFVGPWEQYDRWIDGKAVDYTQPEWREATVNAYARVLAEMTPVTAAQAVVLNSCHGAPELDLPDAVLYQAGRYPDVVNDPARIAAVNDAAREAVRRSGRDIPIIDPSPFLCDGDAHRATIDGVTMHTDGVHFTEEGARLYWEWLGPRLFKAGRSESATPSAPAP